MKPTMNIVWPMLSKLQTFLALFYTLYKFITTFQFTTFHNSNTKWRFVLFFLSQRNSKCYNFRYELTDQLRFIAWCNIRCELKKNSLKCMKKGLLVIWYEKRNIEDKNIKLKNFKSYEVLFIFLFVFAIIIRSCKQWT